MSQSEYSYKIFSHIQELDEVKPFWLKHQHHPYHDFEYYKLCSQIETDLVRPYVISIYKQKKIESLIISSIRNQRVSYQFGYKRLFSHTVPTLDIAYSGILGEASSNHVKILLNALFEGLKNNDYDRVTFDHLNRESQLFKMIRNIHPRRCRDWTPYRNPHWYLKIPNSYDQIYQKLSKSTKGTIRRECNNRISREFGEQVDIKVFSEKSDVKTALTEIETIAKLTYQRKLKVGFSSTQETKVKWEHYADRGMLQIAILYLNKKPAAFWNWILYNNSCLSVNTGFDPNLSYFHPGLYLFVAMIQRFCESQECKTLDFGFGDALYKKMFGDWQTHETSLTIFAPNIRGLKLNLLKNTTINLSHRVQLVLQRMNMDQKIKKIWRKKLVK